MTPILLLGAGRMGGALIDGWRRAGAVHPGQLIVLDPQPGDAARAAEADGALLNPPDAEVARAQTVLVAVKPQLWREAAAGLAAKLAPEAVVVSIAAGVSTADLAAVFRRPVARVMPTTAVAVGHGTATLFSADAVARDRARALFTPVGAVVEVDDEALMHAATGASGSAPAYLYAFVEALEAAGVEAGLPREAARRLARSTTVGAAILMAESAAEPAELRAQVTSPGGTTAAALEVLLGEGGFGDLLTRAVAAAAARSRELGG
ncbi:MAG TPA: pyrroline-5-carboxylate reductase [Phenylobacterium sp.]|nr:pyrroline-5-carboxylate reductase [Phenylobacterium sp.]